MLAVFCYSGFPPLLPPEKKGLHFSKKKVLWRECSPSLHLVLGEDRGAICQSTHHHLLKWLGQGEKNIK